MLSCFSKSVYLYELLSSSTNSVQGRPVSWSAVSTSLSVVLMRILRFLYLSFSALGNAAGFMVNLSWKDQTVDCVSWYHFCEVIFSLLAVQHLCLIWGSAS